LANGPVAVLVGVNNSWYSYSSGIFNAACTATVNHAVIVAGYGYNTTSAQYYYIVRDSWGTSWGEKGYIRILDDGVACSIPKYGYQAVIS